MTLCAVRWPLLARLALVAMTTDASLSTSGGVGPMTDSLKVLLHLVAFLGILAALWGILCLFVAFVLLPFVTV